MEPFPPDFAPDPGRWGAEVLVLHPSHFEAVQEAVMALRDHATVLLNLSALPPAIAQRAADFVAGGAFALDAQQQRLSERVFLFTPHFVHVHHD